MKLLKKIPFHSFLLAPLWVFFLFVHNWDEVTMESIYRSLAVSAVISVVVFAPFFLLFKHNHHKAGVLSTFLLLIFLMYGVVYDFFEKLFYKGNLPVSHIHRYLILIFVMFVAALIIAFFKTKKTWKNVTYPLNVFIIVIFFINIFQLVIFVAYGKKVNIENENTKRNIVADSVAKNSSYPDIYYIILDGYANEQILSQYYDYPNNPFLVYLRNIGFYIADESETNYSFTATSLSSSLNYNYLESITTSVSLSDTMNSSSNLILYNGVSKYLKNKGYSIVHFESGYTITKINRYADVTFKLGTVNEFERALLKYTIFRLDELFGVMHFKRLKTQLDLIEEAIPFSSPKYVFIHIVSPHPPFVCNENGKFRTRMNVVNKWWETRKEYKEQLMYIGKRVQDFIDKIRTTSNRKTIIIVQSDHGPWMKDSNPNNIYEARSKILNAYYIPYEWKNNLYRSISPVNSFRLVFNGVFNDSLKILPDIPVDSAELFKNPIFTNMNRD